MKSFSQRKGLKPVKSVMQVDSMDEDLRNSLWNALTIYYWNRVKAKSSGMWSGINLLSNDRDVEILCNLLWLNYFKKPLDTLPRAWDNVHSEMRKYFFSCEWSEVYDFVEFVAQNFPEKSENQKFESRCNSILEQELSAYRFIGGMITQITSEEEISEIEEALDVSLEPVNTHLKTALDLLADRKSPDYRNSIKESISAVESICKLIVSKDKTTLGDALKEIDKKVELHPALKKAFESLYGYTSDAGGIRHASVDGSDLDFEDAKFMLVSCSAFINYLVVKSSKAGIKL